MEALKLAYEHPWMTIGFLWVISWIARGIRGGCRHEKKS